MKKLLLFTFALFLWTGAWAQTNIVSGKSAVVDNTNTGNEYSEAQLLLITNGVKSNSEDSNVNLKLSKSGSNNVVDWFYIDFGETKTPKTVDITWTNCRPTSYKLYISSEVPTVGNYGTEVFDQTTAPDGGAATKSHSLAGTVSGQYISFVPDQNTYNGWGCIMSEFEVFEAYEQVLTGLTSNRYIYETHQYVPVNVTDQMGATYEGTTTWSMPGCAGFSHVGDGFYFADISQDGYYTLTVTSTENPSQTASKKYGLVRNQPDEEIIPAIDVDNSFVIYSGELNKDAGELSGGWKTPNSKGWDKMNVGSKSSWRIHGFGTFGLKDANLGTDASEIKALYLDIYSLDNHTGTIEIENSSLASNLPFSLVPGWNHVAIEVNTTIASTLKPQEAVVIHLDDATTKAIDEDMLVYNVYYSKVAPVVPSKSVTFNNASWGNVHVYAWYNDGSDHAVTNAWPGDAVGNCAEGNTLTDNEDGTFTWTTTGEPTMIIFNNGGDSPKTADLTFYDGATYDVGGNVKRGYYIVGSMNDWTLGDEYKMTKNNAQTEYNEYMFEQLTLTSTDEFKVCYSADGVIKGDHFPTNNITGNDGPYNVYFCPEGGRGGWINGYVYMQKTYNVVVEGNKATVTGDINTGNLDAVKTAVGMSTYVDVSGATLETYFSTVNPNALYLYATNEDAAAATNTPNPVFKADTRFYSAPKGVIFTDAPAVSDIPKNAFSNLGSTRKFVINRTIAGNSYVTSFMKHAVTSGNQNMTATLADGLEAYELTAAEAGQLTFTKVTGDLVNDKGYVIHNTTSAPLTMTWDSNSNDQVYIDDDDNQDPATVAEIGGVKILGTMHTVITDGSQWILSGGQIMRADGAKITAYRAYFTGVTLPASEGKASAVFVDGETTKIGSINANGEINVENGAVYNLAGQRVAHPTKGIYIVNGKKVIIK